MKFLNDDQKNKVRQTFITSHSPNITAAVNLDKLIVINKKEDQVDVSYPSEVFSEDKEDRASKKYIERFLNVTKSDIFFAKSIIFVEGISEQILISEFAKLMGKDLIDKHISIVNLGDRYFQHFLKLFDTEESDAALTKNIACITDLDPVRKKDEKNAKWKRRNPFSIDTSDKFEYKACYNDFVDKYEDEDYHIRVFSQKEEESSTFEYDLLLSNPLNQDLITESMSNKNEIRTIMKLAEEEDYSVKEILTVMNDNNFKDELKKRY